MTDVASVLADEDVVSGDNRPPGKLAASIAAHLPLILGTGGFVFGVLFIRFDKRRDPGSICFSSGTEFLMWTALIAGQIALWFALAVPLWHSLRRFKMRRAVVVKVAIYSAAALGLISSSLGRSELTPLAHHVWKMRINNLLGAFVVGMALTGIWLAQAALQRLQENIGPKGAQGWYSRQVVKDFLEIRSHLERFLLTAGLFVGAATLATGGLRNAMLAYNSGIYFPHEIVLLYGLVTSGILALIYAPAYAQLVSVRARLRDALAPLPADLSTPAPWSWGGWNSERKAVEELLEIHSGVIASFTGSVSILAPLIASLVAIVLGADK